MSQQLKLLLNHCSGNSCSLTFSCNCPAKPYPDRIQPQNLHFHTGATESCWGKTIQTYILVFRDNSWVINGAWQYSSFPLLTSFPTSLIEYSRIYHFTQTSVSPSSLLILAYEILSTSMRKMEAISLELFWLHSLSQSYTFISHLTGSSSHSSA